MPPDTKKSRRYCCWGGITICGQQTCRVWRGSIPACSSRTRLCTGPKGWKRTMSWCLDCVPQNTAFLPKLQTTRCSTWSLLRRKRIRTLKRGACFMLPSPAPDAIPSCSPRDGPPSSFATELTGGGYDITVFGRPPERDVSCPILRRGTAHTT